jgi:hypothetical protein
MGSVRVPPIVVPRLVTVVMTLPEGTIVLPISVVFSKMPTASVVFVVPVPAVTAMAVMVPEV